MTRLLMVALLCGVSLSALGSAQQPQRDTTGNAAVAAVPASFSGLVVIDDANSTPARRAIVTLQSRINGTTFSEVADARGRYIFAAVPPGEYDLITSKPAFVTTTYGARHPGRLGTPIVLVAGQALTDVRAVLMRGGVISGTVRMANGSPLKNMPVIAIRTRDGVAALSVETDDRGVYRFYGLAPAEYVISAMPENGPGGDSVRRTPAELDALVKILKEHRGRAAAALAQEILQPRPGVRMSYAPTYFPGSTNVALATPVALAPGVVREDIDFKVEMVPTAAITGIVTGVNGQPAVTANLTLVAMGSPGMPAPLTRYGLGRRPDAQGRFSIAGVPPGQYVLEATSGGSSPVGLPQAAASAGEASWASVPVTISGDDQHVNVVLQPAATVEGRVVLVGSTAPPASLSVVRLALEVAGQRRVSRATTGADGSFRFTGLLPDTYAWTVTLPPAISRQWSVQSITANGRELRDAPMQVRTDAPLGAVQVVLTDTPTRLDGTLDVPSGQTPAAYDVILFAADRTLWHAASPRTRLLRPGTNGSFSARDLLAGAYRLAAITASDDDEWKTPAFLESLMEASIPVTIAAGQVTRQDVRIR